MRNSSPTTSAGPREKTRCCRREYYKELHTPPEGTDCAGGWRVVARDWGGGTALMHTGSNTMNYAVVWMAPQKGFAVVAACNQAGDKAVAACNDVCSLLISRHGAK